MLLPKKTMDDFDLSAFVASMKPDILSSPASATDSDNLRRLRESPPRNSTELDDFLRSLPGAENLPEWDVSLDERETIEAESERDPDVEIDDEGLPNLIDSSDNDDENENDSVEELKQKRKSSGRRGGDEVKKDALEAPFLGVLQELCAPCNSTCSLNKDCTKNVSLVCCAKLREDFFGPIGKPAPGDRERANKLMDILKNKTRRDTKDNLLFKLDDKHVCAAAYLRLLGLSSSPDLGKAPGQFRRLLAGYLNGTDEFDLLSAEKLKLDAKDKCTQMRGLQKAFLNMLATYFADSVPVAKYEKGNVCVDVRQLPYRHLTDVYNELQYHCMTATPPVPKSVYGSYSLFKLVYKEMHDAKLIQLLGGKGGFQTCSICNHCLAVKKSAAANRDRSTIEVVRALHRIHLKQEQLERQHCENYIFIAKTMYTPDGQPERWFIELDGMSRFKTLVPKIQKDRKDAISDNILIENRLIGARIVCGPIDQYIGICTGELIPGGCNPNIEAARIALEILSAKLSALATPFALPKIGGFNGDNCGDNKVTDCFVS